MKKLTLLKNILYILLGVAVIMIWLIMEEEKLIDIVPYLVGGVMYLYGVTEIVSMIAKKTKINEHTKLPEVIVLFILGTLMIVLGKDDLTLTCIFWAVWGLEREGMEIAEKVLGTKNYIVGGINLAESIVLIIFSIMLISEPGEHHALTHVFLLGLELIFEILFTVLDDLPIRFGRRNIEKGTKEKE